MQCNFIMLDLTQWMVRKVIVQVIFLVILKDLWWSSYRQVEHWVSKNWGAILLLLLLFLRVAGWIAIKLDYAIICLSPTRVQILVSREVHRLEQSWLRIVIEMMRVCVAAKDGCCGIWNEINCLLQKLISWKALSVWVSNCCSSSLLLFITESVKETRLALPYRRHLVCLGRRLNYLSQLSFGLHGCMHAKHKITRGVRRP